MRWHYAILFPLLGSIVISLQCGCITLPDLGAPESAQTLTTPKAPSADTTASQLGSSAGVPGYIVETSDSDPAAPASEPGLDQSAAPLTLTALIQLALSSNPDLRSASERVRIAEAALRRADAEFYPQLLASEDYAVTNIPDRAFSYLLDQGYTFPDPRLLRSGTVEDAHTQLQFQESIYAGGRRLANTQAAEALRQADLFALAAVRNELVYRVTQAYYRLLQARDLVEVRSQAVDQVTQHLRMVEARFRSKTALRSDVLAVQVRLAEVQEALISARHGLELAWAVLENVLGQPAPTHVLPIGVPPVPWESSVAAVEAAAAEATRNRPERLELGRRQRAAEHDVRAAAAGNYPSVNVFGDYDVYAGDVHGRDSFFVGLAVSLKLFDGGRVRSDVQRAQARVRELEARQQRQCLDIELEVRRAHLQLEDARQRLQVATEAIRQAEQSLHDYEVRYNARTATLTQLIDAQIALSNAQVREHNAQADVAIASAALERALGHFSALVQGPRCSPS
ncbi:MAG TPA: TolC family protein [Gemmataceae bacterium]|nr:TolC family protein [Gemmataceae bacterium]